MKKFAVLLLTLALFCAMSVPAFAATITTGSGREFKNVFGTYQAGSATTVYSVDITWGNMKFTYVDASDGEWNPLTHTYDGATTAGWTCDEGANEITVTNHSNAAVGVTLTYSATEGYAGISGTFDKNTLNLATADGTARDEAPTATATLTLRGALASTVTEEAMIGQVIVQLN